MKKKYILGLCTFLVLSVITAAWVHAAERIKNPTPVPDGQYTIDYMVIDVNSGHPEASFGLADDSGNENSRRTNNHPFLITSEFDFKDGVYDKGSIIRVSKGGTVISLIKNTGGVSGK